MGAAAGVVEGGVGLGAGIPAGSAGEDDGAETEVDAASPVLKSPTLPEEARTSAGREQENWGIAAVVRTAEIPFEGSPNNNVASFVPMLFFEGERFFWRGLGGGMHLWTEGEVEFNAITRGRFFDIPAELQNEIQGDTADFGLQALYGPSELWVEGEWMTDTGGRQHLNARVGRYQRLGRFDLIPSLNVRYKSRDFNDYYFALSGLTGESAGSGWELRPSVLARYHLWSDVYLLGSASYTLYDSGTSDLSAIDGPGQAELLLGFGFFQDRNTSNFLGHNRGSAGPGREISTPPYVRLAHGWATPSSLGEILRFNWEDDEFDNQLTSVFYGYPLTDELFGVPLDVYLTPGFVWHHSSAVQSSSQEFVLALKVYYTLKWPTTWRIGVAEGLSYINDVTYIERVSLEESGYKPSKLMNYLDFSFDLNVGDLVNSPSLRKLWFGWSIHHRSSIFESASQFGRIKGGSNYNTVYLQFDIL